MRDLLVTTHTPVLRSGQAARTYGVARALAANRGLTLLYARFDAPEPDAAFRSIPGIEFVEVVPSRRTRRLMTYGSARLRGVPAGFARGVSPELARAAERLAADADRGRVIADGPIAAAALMRLSRVRAVTYNAHNVESSFRGDLDGGARALQGLRRFERGLLARAEESWMVSETDLAAARELCPGARLRYVPNVVDVSAIRAVTPNVRERRVLFVASFVYEPNQNGLRFLLERVFPRVWREVPDAILTLVGAGLEHPPSGDPRVEALGFVDDLAQAYASASCVVVPLLQGGGTPLKFVEALAYGMPVVATGRAAAGLAVRDGEHALLADGEQEFAAALVRVLRDGAADIARHGRELAEERYSIEALSKLLAS
ncbi:MAG: glycosyl transferase [Solirubrobacterales bacterium]|nr:glycosyl transferase [Solirubrobacterales bacterium]